MRGDVVEEEPACSTARPGALATWKHGCRRSLVVSGVAAFSALSTSGKAASDEDEEARCLATFCSAGTKERLVERAGPGLNRILLPLVGARRASEHVSRRHMVSGEF